jgi:hypothetical protein
MDPSGNVMGSPVESEDMVFRDSDSRRESDTSGSETEEVNWEELEKTEEQEPRSESSDDVSNFLLPL